MLSIRHSIGKTPLLEHIANHSKSVAHFRCYASPPLTGVYAREVRYWRHYLVRKGGGGFYPVDARIGLTGDGFSPLVMSLVTRLATRVSFAASVRLFRCFYGWAPSSEAVQHLIIGMGKDSGAYMEHAQ